MIVRTATHVFLRGLFVILPVGLTLYVLWWLASSIEKLVAGMLGWANRAYDMPIDWYVPGLGLAIAFVAVFIVGLAMSTWVARQLWDATEGLIAKTPGLSTIYGAFNDFVQFFNKDQKDDLDQVVLVDLPGAGADMKQIGFVTRSAFDDLPEQLGADGRVAVYLPMSYQIGGFTVFIPRDRVEAIDMKLEDAMRFVLTAGVNSNGKSGV